MAFPRLAVQDFGVKCEAEREEFAIMVWGGRRRDQVSVEVTNFPPSTDTTVREERGKEEEDIKEEKGKKRGKTDGKKAYKIESMFLPCFASSYFNNERRKRGSRRKETKKRKKTWRRRKQSTKRRKRVKSEREREEEKLRQEENTRTKMSISPSYPRDSVSLLPSTCTRVYMIRERVKEEREGGRGRRGR